MRPSLLIITKGLLYYVIYAITITYIPNTVAHKANINKIKKKH